jgi:hypothetical protein
MSNNNQSATVARHPSTGPRTEAGNAISSQNARKHDLCSRTLRLTPEEWAEYNDLCARYRRDLRPASEPEQTLVDEICFNYWRLQQAREVELRVILEYPADLGVISLYIRYRTSYERGFYKALDRLHKLQADIRRQAPVRSANSVSQSKPAAGPAVPAASALAAVPPQPVRSANVIPGESSQLQEQLEDHLLENRVRSELHLPPLPLPKPLRKQVDQFVSKNPALAHKELYDLLRRAA